MGILIERGHREIYSKIAADINKSFKQKSYKLNPKKTEKLLEKKTVSIEKKKKELIIHLHGLIIKTFSISPKKINKNNIRLIRSIVNKLRDINYYLQTVFLEELGLIKKTAWKEKNIKKEKSYIPRKELERIEHVVFKLIEKIIFLDKKLLKKYKAKEENIAKKEEAGVKDTENILRKQSELLRHLESKLPPPTRIKANLLKKTAFTDWTARLFALLAALENENRKEAVIFKKLKQNDKARKRINMRINDLIKEKWDLLKVKESRILSMERIAKIEEEHKKRFHSFISASRL